jgi:hypothetical protein
VKRPDRRLCVRGTSSNTISAYRDCITLADPADPPVLSLLGCRFSDLSRPCSGLWVRDSLTVGVCAPVFGESVMLTSPVVIAWAVVESGGELEGGVTFSVADIGATA